MPKKKSLLASRRVIEANRFLGQIVIVVEGELPTPGWEVDIEQRQSHEGTLSFQVVRRAKPGMWAQVQTPFRYGEMFEVEQVPDEIEVLHAEGVDRVVVIDRKSARKIPEDTAQGGAPAEEPPVEHVATGFSPSLSFDEAFADALQNLPGVQPTHPDQMVSVKVEEIGALFGGIAGFHQMYVRLRRQIA